MIIKQIYLFQLRKINIRKIINFSGIKKKNIFNIKYIKKIYFNTLKSNLKNNNYNNQIIFLIDF